MGQINNTSWENATLQLTLAEKSILQAQKKLQSESNNPHPEEQYWMQEALGAMNNAKDILNGIRNSVK